MLNGEGQEVIKAAACGWSVNSDDVEGLAKTLKELTKIKPEKLKAIGENGYRFYTENFELNLCINKIDNALERIRKKAK